MIENRVMTRGDFLRGTAGATMTAALGVTPNRQGAFVMPAKDFE